MTGSTYLEFDKTLNKAQRMIKSDDNKSFALLVVCGLNLGLRIGDLLTFTFKDLRSDTVTFKEQKTNKERTVKINDNIKQALTYFEDEDDKHYAFKSQKGTVYSIQRINVLLKERFKGCKVGDGVVSSHSLRKAFGRRIWSNDGESERALIKLSELFNHSNVKVTRTYLGIQQDELNDLYINL
jgi:integrase